MAGRHAGVASQAVGEVSPRVSACEETVVMRKKDLLFPTRHGKPVVFEPLQFS
jgi:hypothetical protein